MATDLTVSKLAEIAGISVHSPEHKIVLKSYGIMLDNESIDMDNRSRMLQYREERPNAVVFLDSAGRLQIRDSPKVAEKKAESSSKSEGVKVTFSPAKVNELLEGKSLSIDNEKIRSVLEKFMKDLPKTAETYAAGSIIIKYYKGVEITISSLLSAGTKILDAIMYSAYKESPEHNFIFHCSELNPTVINGNELIENVSNGHKAIKASFCSVYNQGGLPGKGMETRPVSKFIRETVFKVKDLDTAKLSDLLSSADPSFFPASVFLQVPLDHLPTEVSSRCKMSIAGNKAIRYSVLAKRFEQDQVLQPSESTAESMKTYMEKSAKLDKAIRITDTLSSIGSNFEAQKRMHPLSTLRPTRKNFTLQLTCAIVFSLSRKGREAMRKMIDENNIAAFKRDENIYGSENSLKMIYYPVLTNPDADFSELSVEAVRAAYGLS